MRIAFYAPCAYAAFTLLGMSICIQRKHGVVYAVYFLCATDRYLLECADVATNSGSIKFMTSISETPTPQTQREPVSSTSASPALTREIIATEALRLACDCGLENLSARMLASSLGKTPMALYRHYSCMDDIRLAAVAVAFREVDTSEIPGERWDDTMRRTTKSVRDLHLRYAGARLERVKGAAWDLGLQEHTERVQRLHTRQGIPADVLMRAWRIIDAFLTGFICNELNDIEFDISQRAISGDDAPTWIETAQGTCSDQAFADDLEIIIAGIRSLASPDPCEWCSPLE